jgi:hypothetical protein
MPTRIQRSRRHPSVMPPLPHDGEKTSPPLDYDLDVEGVASEIEAELTPQRDERISPFIVIAAVAGLAIGLYLWGSLAISLTASAGDLFDDANTTSAGADTVTPTPMTSPEATITPSSGSEVNRLDCDEIRGTVYRSSEERTWFLANCVN